jgi:hypothetical protein
MGRRKSTELAAAARGIARSVPHRIVAVALLDDGSNTEIVDRNADDDDDETTLTTSAEIEVEVDDPFPAARPRRPAES